MMLGHLVFLCLCAAALAAKVKLDKAFIQEVVDRHNEYRAAHGVNPVVANRKISKYAQKWANYLINNNLFKHRTKNKYGENLSWMSGNVNGADHVDNLYIAEQQYYETNNYYGKEPPLADFAEYGHYTQIVWKSSRKIGVGIAGPVVVINYKPSGNFIGSFKRNVPRPQ